MNKEEFLKIIRLSFETILGRPVDKTSEKIFLEYFEKNGFEEGYKYLIRYLTSEDGEFFIRRYFYFLDHPFDKTDEYLYVFLHIRKTGGSSLAYMLREVFGSEYCTLQTPDIYIYPLTYLLSKKVIVTHSDLDTIRYFLPRKLRIFTILRNPLDRMRSFYQFLSVFDPKYYKENQDPFIFIANKFDIVGFYKHPLVRSYFWNTMTKQIVGLRIYKNWKNYLEKLPISQRNQFLENTVRPTIRKILDKFLFVGILEKFEDSLNLLFKILNKPTPEIKKLNVTKEIVGIGTTKEEIRDVQITDELIEIVKDLIVLDNICYQEGLKIFEKLKIDIESNNTKVKEFEPYVNVFLTSENKKIFSNFKSKFDQAFKKYLYYRSINLKSCFNIDYSQILKVENWMKFINAWKERGFSYAWSKAKDKIQSRDLIKWRMESRIVSKKLSCPICSNKGLRLLLEGKNFFQYSKYIGFYRCDNCGHVLAYPFEYPKYDKIHPYWYIDFYVQQGAGIDFMIRPLVKLNLSQKSFLDVGCGSGFTVDFAEKIMNCEACGVEPGFYAKEGERILGIKIYKDYLENVKQLKGKKFDVVYSSEVIEHIKDVYNFINLLAQYLKDDGVLIITTPNADYLLSENLRYSTVLEVLFLGFHVNIFSSKSIKILLKNLGFSHIVVEKPLDHQVIIYASRTNKIELRDYNEEMFRKEIYLPYLENLFMRDNPLLKEGSGWRLFKELVNFGEYEKAERVYRELSKHLLEQYGIDILQAVEVCNKLMSVEDLGDFGKVAPYFIGGFYYYLGMMYLNYFADYDKASELFKCSFEILLKQVKLAPAYYEEAADLIWLAKFHEGLAYRYAGNYSKALEVYSYILENKSGRNTINTAPNNLILERITKEFETLSKENYD